MNTLTDEPKLHYQPPVYRADLPLDRTFNRQLEKEYLNALKQGKARQTHHFMGRFENTYIDRDDLPALQMLVPVVLTCASRILQRPAGQLRFGFWFNEIQHGDKTSRHAHEENDELLSAVYYVNAPKDSGNLVVIQEEKKQSLEPIESRIYLFDPSLEHCVEENCSNSMRLSLAFNFGPT